MKDDVENTIGICNQQRIYIMYSEPPAIKLVLVQYVGSLHTSDAGKLIMHCTTIPLLDTVLAFWIKIRANRLAFGWMESVVSVYTYYE